MGRWRPDVDIVGFARTQIVVADDQRDRVVVARYVGRVSSSYRWLTVSWRVCGVPRVGRAANRAASVCQAQAGDRVGRRAIFPIDVDREHVRRAGVVDRHLDRRGLAFVDRVVVGREIEQLGRDVVDRDGR